MRTIEEAMKSDVLQADEVKTTLNSLVNQMFQKFMDHQQVQVDSQGHILYYKNDVGRFIERLQKIDEEVF